MKAKYETVEVEAQIVSSDRIPVNGHGEEFGRGWRKNTEIVKRRYKIRPRKASMKLQNDPTQEHCGQPDRDAQLLRNCEPDRIFYGPYCCEVCQRVICRVSIEQGGMKFDYPEGHIYPNTNWTQHVCVKEGA